MIEAVDRGFTLGDGLFETVLAEAGELRRLEAHLDRLAAGCAVLGLPEPDRADAARRMKMALTETGLAGARAAVRLTWTAGGGGRGLDRPEPLQPAMVVTAARAPAPQEPARVVIAQVRRNEQSPASRVKSLSYLDNVLARREARAAGADEALMLNTAGELACAAAANLFWIAGGRIYTPHLDCGVLAGVTRARVIAAAAKLGEPARAVRNGPEALENAEAVFLTNSLIGLRPVISVGRRKYSVSSVVAELEAALD